MPVYEKKGSDLTIFLTLTSTYTVRSLTTSSSPSHSTSTADSSSTTPSSSSELVAGSAPVFYVEPSSTSSPTSSSTAFASSLTPISVSASTSLSASSSVAHSTTHTASSSASPMSVDGYLKNHESGMSSSLKLGLALGIPLTFVTFFAIIALVWYLIKRKSNSKSFLHYNDDFFEVKKHTFDDNSTLAENKLSTLLFKPKDTSKPRDISEHWQNSTEEMSLKEVPRRDIELSLTRPRSFFSRMSQVFNLADNDPTAPSRWSPMILKKFNLYHSPEKISPQVVAKPDTNKRLPKLPPIISTYNPSSSTYKSSLAPTTAYITSLNNMENVTSWKPKVYIVVINYTKRLPDELTIRQGDKVTIVKEFPDTWCLVRIISSFDKQVREKVKGMVPRNCLLIKADLNTSLPQMLRNDK